MNSLQNVKKMLSGMSPGEKAQLLQWVVQDIGNAFPGIDIIPGVCGGAPIIVRTRIPVWTLVAMKRLGTSEADILKAYPRLRAEDLANAWAYYRIHSAEIDQQILENEEV